MWRTAYYFPQAYRNLFMSQEELRTLQEKRLRYMVEFAYRNVRLYREKFEKAHVSPHDIRTLEDVKRIPLTTKEEMKNVFPEGVVAPGFNESNCRVRRTSGSTGSVFTILFDAEALARVTAVDRRDHVAMGVRPWRKFYLIFHDPAGIRVSSRKQLFPRVLRVSGLNTEEELVNLARTYKPYVMGGHPTAFVAMAKIMERKGIEDINPRIVLIGGEMAYPLQRRYIEKVFKCETFNRYGSYETFSIAWECRQKKLHMDTDAVIVEFLKDGEPASPGERGEIVVTNLWNKAMPFIRYRLNDIGIPSDEVCSCGVTLPLMKDFEGRADDFIVLPSGRVVPPTRLVPLFFTSPFVEQFKIIQNTRASITIKMIPKGNFTEKEEKNLMKMVQDVFDEPVDLTMEKVDHIEQTGVGKFKAVLSKVPLNLAP